MTPNSNELQMPLCSFLQADVQPTRVRNEVPANISLFEHFLQTCKCCAVQMGPSGSGKTTFLDVLAGRKSSGSLSGTIRYGGLPPSRSLLRRATGYVEQFDTLVDCLSCYEMLLYTAQLKRPRSESISAKQAAVTQLLGKLSLAGCESSTIGNPLKRGISGGQAKRLNIGIALITDPRVLFLDEPTSGLDSFTANEVMRVVAGLAADGTTIATTIHSPSSYCFGLFDQLLLLLEGRLVYLGGAEDAAIAYFMATCGARQPRVGDNLAEWMLDAVTQAGRDRSKGSLAHAYHESQQYRVSDNDQPITALVVCYSSDSSVIQKLPQVTE
jgi:ABC-type multidrug transport system ATPase subunit